MTTRCIEGDKKMTKENDKPEIDYWMVALLRKSVNTQMQKETSKYSSNPEYIEKAINDRNEWNPIGQLQVIQDRLNELQLFYDNQIKEWLKKK